MSEKKRKLSPEGKKTREESIAHVTRALGIYWQARDDLQSAMMHVMKQLNGADREEIIDLLGSVRQVQKVADKLEGMYKAALTARIDTATDSEVRGGNFMIFVSKKERVTFDNKLVKAEVLEQFGDDVEGYQEWLKAHEKSTEYVEIKTKALSDAEEESEG